MSYAIVSQFVIIINRISFPCKGEDFSFISTKFHTVSSTPTTNGIKVKLWKCTVSCRVMVPKIWISSGNKKYLTIIKTNNNNHNSILIY